MNKLERITKNIFANKQIIKALAANEYYSLERFISDIKCYIAALKAGRVQYYVSSVSKSGMSRCIVIQSCERSNRGYHYRQYNAMLRVLSYTVVRGYTDSIRVNGCGMNMLFATNYNLIHSFCTLGFVGKKECNTLAQKIQ